MFLEEARALIKLFGIKNTNLTKKKEAEEPSDYVSHYGTIQDDAKNKEENPTPPSASVEEG